MKLGIFGINFGPCGDPDVAARIAQYAEAAGIESAWTGEHVVLPEPQAPPSPLAPGDRIADPIVTLAFLAALTTRIRLGTGIIILPQRNPLVLAKELASVDVLSKGRLIFGLGIGYLKPEFDALGISFAHKGPRSIEYLEAMLAVWTQAKPAYSGRFVSFSGIQALPRPVQQPHPPIVIGGGTPEAFARAIRYGNGWYGFARDLDGTAEAVKGLQDAAQQHERPAALGPLEISITPRGKLDADAVARFAALGVHRLIPAPMGASETELMRFIEKFAPLVGRPPL